MKVLGVIPARAKAPVEERSRYCKPTISITGFPREVMMKFTRGVNSGIILMDGSDFSLVLEGTRFPS